MKSEITNPVLIQVVKTYWLWRFLWISTTGFFAMLGLSYVTLLKKDLWIASQGVIVRDEANGAVMRLGRFESQTEMKAAQETILEMARNAQVIREALSKIGPKENRFGLKRLLDLKRDDSPWPNTSHIQDVADNAISVHAPKGASFGTTEVIYLDVKQDSPERAVALNRALCDALEQCLQSVRKSRALGVIAELEHARDIAQKQLTQVTEQMQVVEREAGADLSDLRGMTDNNSGGNTSRQQLDSLNTEIRQAEHQHQTMLTDLNLLRETLKNPSQLSAAPGSLLMSQPGLKRLREGLADAQLALSSLQGRYSDSHPHVIAAMNARVEIEAKLQKELFVSAQSIQNDVHIGQKRIDELKSLQNQVVARMDSLARVRATYENLVNELHTRTNILQAAERDLAQAQASCDAALSTSLLTRLDKPVLGERPVGPGRLTILCGTAFAGLFFGLGIVFLLTPIDSGAGFGRRTSDAGRGMGRRFSDRFPWLATGRQEVRCTDVDGRVGNQRAQSLPNMPAASASAQGVGDSLRAEVATNANRTVDRALLVATGTSASFQQRSASVPKQSAERRLKTREEPSRTFSANQSKDE